MDNQKKVFLYNEIAICGVIKSELLRGTSSEKQFIEVFNALDCFNYLFFEESDWSELAKLFVDLRKNGISIPFQDGMIAYLARSVCSGNAFPYGKSLKGKLCIEL